jgi:hypothetical protein
MELQSRDFRSGVGITALLATMAFGLAKMPLIEHLEPLSSALLLEKGPKARNMRTWVASPRSLLATILPEKICTTGVGAVSRDKPWRLTTATVRDLTDPKQLAIRPRTRPS